MHPSHREPRSIGGAQTVPALVGLIVALLGGCGGSSSPATPSSSGSSSSSTTTTSTGTISGAYTLNGGTATKTNETLTSTAADTSAALVTNGGVLTLTLDRTISWTLTGTSYLTSLSDTAGISGSAITNITGNGFNVYYDGSATSSSALGGRTYSLVNGGQLIPR